MRNDDHETTTQHNNATPIRRVDARTHDKTHNRTTPLLLAKRGVHASSSDYMVHQLSPEYFDTSHYYCTSIQVPHISYRMRTNTSVYVWVPFGYIDHTRFAICAVSTCFGLFFVVSCHCCVRQEPAVAGHGDEHSGRRSSSNNGGAVRAVRPSHCTPQPDRAPLPAVTLGVAKTHIERGHARLHCLRL